MAPRKRKASPRLPAQDDVNGNTSPAPSSGRRVKRKIDWGTIGDSFNGFTLQPVKSRKERKSHGNGQQKVGATDTDAEIYQPNPYGAHATISDTHYRVEQDHEWDSTNRYRKFTIQEAEFEVGGTVYIRADESQNPDPKAAIPGWVAKVLEVRAGNENHVFLRVYWMYRPEDLPGGRQPYHGRHEVIASNDMAIIDALSVDGRADVIHWTEQDEQVDVLDPTKLYWRQTYDVAGKKGILSQLPRHCIDNLPANPDQMLVQCHHCQRWLHGSCLEEQAVKDTYQSQDLKYPGSNEAPGKESHLSSSTKVTPKKTGKKARLAFSAKIKSLEDGQTRLTVIDQRKGQQENSWNIAINCLLCGKVIEQADASEGGMAEGEKESMAQVLARRPKDEEDSVIGTLEDDEASWSSKDAALPSVSPTTDSGENENVYESSTSGNDVASASASASASVEPTQNGETVNGTPPA